MSHDAARAAVEAVLISRDVRNEATRLALSDYIGRLAAAGETDAKRLTFHGMKYLINQ